LLRVLIDVPEVRVAADTCDVVTRTDDLPLRDDGLDAKEDGELEVTPGAIWAPADGRAVVVPGGGGGGGAVTPAFIETVEADVPVATFGAMPHDEQKPSSIVPSHPDRTHFI
jgi:hypothetical protein